MFYCVVVVVVVFCCVMVFCFEVVLSVCCPPPALEHQRFVVMINPIVGIQTFLERLFQIVEEVPLLPIAVVVFYHHSSFGRFQSSDSALGRVTQPSKARQFFVYFHLEDSQNSASRSKMNFNDSFTLSRTRTTKNSFDVFESVSRITRI